MYNSKKNSMALCIADSFNKDLSDAAQPTEG